MWSKYIYIVWTWAVAAMLLTACTDSDIAVSSDDGGQPVAIQFDPYMTITKTDRGTAGATVTRADPVPVTRPTVTGEINTLADLQIHGFGVFASYSVKNTYSSKYHDWGTGTGAADNAGNGAKANFMYNQPVTYAATTWQYSPVKYWPNGEGEASDATGTGATPHYVQFFAYAPYINDDGHNYDNAANTGVVGVANNNTGMNHMTVTYRYPSVEPVTASEGVDLLWAVPLFDQTKQAVGETLTLTFKHALAKLNIEVQGVFDEVTPGSNDIDSKTKILIESVTISNAVLPLKGYLVMEPRTLDNLVPQWRYQWEAIVDGKKKEGAYKISTETGSTYSDLFTKNLTINADTHFNTDLTATGRPVNTDAEYTTETAWTKFGNLPTGVTSTAQSLLADGYYYRLIPNTYYDPNDDGTTVVGTDPGAELGPITVRVVYYVITYDESLVLNNPKYFSIVKNDVTRTMDTAFTFDAGKVYTLLLRLGMTTAKLEAGVTTIDWNDAGTQTKDIP